MSAMYHPVSYTHLDVYKRQLQKKCVNPLGFNFQRIHNLLGNPHSRQLQIENSQKKETNNTSQMRLGSVFKMRMSILNTATTEQMGCIICFFFRLLPNLQIRIYKSMRSIVCSSILCRFVYPVRISVKAPSPVTLQAVPKPVSYTHLDVYKRQCRSCLFTIKKREIVRKQSVFLFFTNTHEYLYSCLLYTSRCV